VRTVVEKDSATSLFILSVDGSEETLLSSAKGAVVVVEVVVVGIVVTGGIVGGTMGGTTGGIIGGTNGGMIGGITGGIIIGGIEGPPAGEQLVVVKLISLP